MNRRRKRRRNKKSRPGTYGVCYSSDVVVKNAQGEIVRVEKNPVKMHKNARGTKTTALRAETVAESAEKIKKALGLDETEGNPAFRSNRRAAEDERRKYAETYRRILADQKNAAERKARAEGRRNRTKPAKPRRLDPTATNVSDFVREASPNLAGFRRRAEQDAELKKHGLPTKPIGERQLRLIRESADRLNLRLDESFLTDLTWNQAIYMIEAMKAES